MADKKITALTELAATGKNAAADFLHIIDFSASPVNKKITVASLFSNANTDTHIYGVSKTFEIGSSAAASSAIKVTTGSLATLTAAAGRKNEVIINDDGVAYIDFKVKSKTSDQALVVDADADTVTINGDSTVLDFVVKGDTTTLIHADGGLDAVGIGTASPETAFTMTVAATGTKSIKTLGTIEVGTSATIGAPSAGILALPSVESITTGTASTNHGTTGVATTMINMTGTSTGVLPNSTVVGQIKIITCIAKTGSVTYTNTPATMNGFTSFRFDAVGDSVVLMWQTAGWTVIATGETTQLTA
jgi:hypothetical protein